MSEPRNMASDSNQMIRKLQRHFPIVPGIHWELRPNGMKQVLFVQHTGQKTVPSLRESIEDVRRIVLDFDLKDALDRMRIVATDDLTGRGLDRALAQVRAKLQQLRHGGQPKLFLGNGQEIVPLDGLRNALASAASRCGGIAGDAVVITSEGYPVGLLRKWENTVSWLAYAG